MSTPTDDFPMGPDDEGFNRAAYCRGHREAFKQVPALLARQLDPGSPFSYPEVSGDAEKDGYSDGAYRVLTGLLAILRAHNAGDLILSLSTLLEPIAPPHRAPLTADLLDDIRTANGHPRGHLRRVK
jgi:hypothetical protein